MDSTISRAHQHAAGARRDGAAQKEPPGGVDIEPADHGLGRSRGGLTSKIHLACEHGQRLLSLVVTAGQRGDSPQFVPVSEAIRVPRPGAGRPRCRPDRVRADKAYRSKATPTSNAYSKSIWAVGCAAVSRSRTAPGNRLPYKLATARSGSVSKSAGRSLS